MYCRPGLHPETREIISLISLHPRERWERDLLGSIRIPISSEEREKWAEDIERERRFSSLSFHSIIINRWIGWMDEGRKEENSFQSLKRWSRRGRRENMRTCRRDLWLDLLALHSLWSIIIILEVIIIKKVNYKTQHPNHWATCVCYPVGLNPDLSKSNMHFPSSLHFTCQGKEDKVREMMTLMTMMMRCYTCWRWDREKHGYEGCKREDTEDRNSSREWNRERNRDNDTIRENLIKCSITLISSV